MIAWLSDWLKDIIAVIMLAAFVELLLPNKAMLRYARLVIGLLILLTIMSPILRLLQGDFNAKLKDGITHWDQLEPQHEVKMPTLSDIQKKADELNQQQNNDAAALMEQTLEAAMKDAVVKQMKLAVEAVDVSLNWEKQGQKLTPTIASVLLTLPADKEEPAGTAEPDEEDVKEVSAISVDVDVRTETDETGKQQAEAGRSEASNGWVQANPSESKEIRGLLAEGWGINPANVQVRQRAGNSE
ncbi:stage III sporulation protein AF [Paenibacillus sp. BK033]|uniref:stage III sporulation protein AF n=1 Tax=unclassified Paenibacillus TaxID=185978 RepID=UPI00104CE719|nr:stage III sporulation protein AF [Paenibacillus sp. BK033]NIK67602.1 stage III sporulation protein AF [Paenibacillus sp. BK720]TCN01643.1 stage III sporulation protein AF [Paenibacillus sp. BK033]